MKLSDYLRGTPAHPVLVQSPDPQCTATTKSGARCKLPRLTIGDKCVIHQVTAAERIHP